jgi:hypothetical protein
MLIERWTRSLPIAITLVAAVALLIHGPIQQTPDYHRFADDRAWMGIADAANVISNLGFAVVGAWGMARLSTLRAAAALGGGMPGFSLLLLALILTAAGSAYYHLAPDDSRLVWDRIPIGLACAGLLAGVRGQLAPAIGPLRLTSFLALLAVATVLWWHLTDAGGEGDLGPYLLLQVSPLILVPLWQLIYRAPRADRRAYALAIALYVAAKLAEIYDRPLYVALHGLSGHTLKHLLATAAAAVIVLHLTRTARNAGAARSAASSRPGVGASADLLGLCGAERISGRETGSSER